MSYYRQGPFRPSGSGVRFGVPGLTPYIKLIMIVCGAVWLVEFGLFLAYVRTAGNALVFSERLHAYWDVVGFFGLVPQAVVAKFRIWQPLTYMFLHDPTQMFHILLNMLMLWMFGGELERHWGSKPFLRYYLVCGIGAGLLAIPFGYAVGTADKITIGASGAIFGLFVAYGMVFAERPVLFMLIFPMKARTMAIIMCAMVLFYTITQPQGNVSHIAHLGGGLVGFLYLKRAWRVGELYRELKWRVRRRQFKVMPKDDKNDFDHWVN